MKYLDQEKNDNFYIDKNNMLHNINKKQPLEYCEPTPGAMQDLICLCECKEYKNGVLVHQRDFSKQRVVFYSNNGDKIFDISRNKRDNKGFVEMDAYVCESGILVATQNSITGREYLYKFYDGWTNWSDDFEKLKRMVDFRDNFKKYNTERNQ